VRVLVTGAAGFLGERLLRALRATDWQVRAFARRAPPEAAEVVLGDVGDADALAAAMSGVDAVVHLAALVEGQPPVDTFDTNVRGTYLALEAAIAAGVARFVFASSIAATGCLRPTFRPSYLPIDEEHPCTPASPYSVSKLVGEELCRAATRRCGIETVALRFAAIAPWLDDRPWDTMYRGGWRTGPEPATVRSTVLWTGVFVEDAAAAIRRALDAPLPCRSLVADVCAAEPCALEPTERLAARFFPDVERRSGDGFFSIERARAAFGFHPVESFVAFAAEHNLRLEERHA
jgi:nucleoside-diphosphate-sugar epimerase